MTGAAIDFSVTGAREIERQMLALVNSGENLSEFNDAFGLILESNTIDRFDRETDPAGQKWQKSERAKAEGGKTLTDTARLKGSIAYEASATSIRVGTNVAYARVHQDGFSGTQKVATHKRTMSQVFGLKLQSPIEVIVPAFQRSIKMPVRAYLGFGPEDEQDGRALATDFFPNKAPGLFAGGTA